MKTQIKVLLTVKCRNMRHPKAARSRFDQTLGTNSWMLQENRKPEIHEDGTVTTASVWGRTFSDRKTEENIARITRNLLGRAAEDAMIDEYDFDLEFEIVQGNRSPFKNAPVLTQDD